MASHLCSIHMLSLWLKIIGVNANKLSLDLLRSKIISQALCKVKKNGGPPTFSQWGRPLCRQRLSQSLDGPHVVPLQVGHYSSERNTPLDHLSYNFIFLFKFDSIILVACTILLLFRNHRDSKKLWSCSYMSICLFSTQWFGWVVLQLFWNYWALLWDFQTILILTQSR